MPSGFTTGGTDLDDVFDPYVEGTKPAATGYTAAGTDLKERYAPLSYGTAAPVTGMSISGGADLNTLWAAKGTAVYAGPVAPGIGASYTETRAVTSGGVTSTLVLTIKSDGTWTVSGNGTPSELAGVPVSGTWHSDPAPSVGGGARVRFHDADPWLDLSVDRAVTVTASASVGVIEYATNSIDCHIAISNTDGTRQVAAATTLTADAYAS